jgi:hypothetical protein
MNEESHSVNRVAIMRLFLLMEKEDGCEFVTRRKKIK